MGGTGDLLRRSRQDAVLRVDADHDRLPGPGLGLVYRLGERGDDDDVAGLGVARSGSVDADDARARVTWQSVGLQATPVAGVPDVNTLVRQDVRCLQQRLV